MASKPKLLTDRFEDFSARLDWRFQRALALFGDEELPVPGFDDGSVVKAYKFIKAFEETTTISQRQLLRQRYPFEVRAYDYFLNSDSRRYRLEAMCLCPDLTPTGIASILDEKVEVVTMFEKFFFDTRERKRDAVFNAIFPPNVFKTYLGSNVADKVWKFFAMVGGFRLLSCLINPYTADNSTIMELLSFSKRQLGVDFSVARLLQPVDNREDLKDITEAIGMMLELDFKERASNGNAIPEAQANVLRKCIEATHIQVMQPDDLLMDAYEPTVEDLLASRELSTKVG